MWIFDGSTLRPHDAWPAAFIQKHGHNMIGSYNQAGQPMTRPSPSAALSRVHWYSGEGYGYLGCDAECLALDGGVGVWRMEYLVRSWPSVPRSGGFDGVKAAWRAVQGFRENLGTRYTGPSSVAMALQQTAVCAVSLKDLWPAGLKYVDLDEDFRAYKSGGGLDEPVKMVSITADPPAPRWVGSGGGSSDPIHRGSAPTVVVSKLLGAQCGEGRRPFTPAESQAWSAALKIKVKLAERRERERVLVDRDFEDWE